MNVTCALVAAGAHAQAPVNDDCSGAIAIPIGGMASSDNTTATDSSPPEQVPSCTPVGTEYAGGDLWFSTTVGPNGALTLDADSGPWSTVQAAAYTGACGGGP